jgi:hypothetical protein
MATENSSSSEMMTTVGRSTAITPSYLLAASVKAPAPQFLSPFQGFSLVAAVTQGLRPFDKLRAGSGLHSFAALRLGFS